MLKALLVVLAVACAFGSPSATLAGQYTGSGQYVGTPSGVVTNLFARFPDGGPGLTQAIVNLLTANPSLAADVAFVASRGNLAQKVAAAQGIRQAIIALAALGNGAAADAVLDAALLSADPVIVAGARGGDPTNLGLAFGQQLFVPSNNPGQTTGCTTQTVSPTRPC